MIGIFSTLLLVVAQQAPSLPFEFQLPEGYPAFSPTGEGSESWISTRADGVASFRVSHYLLGAFGALPEAVAEDIRQRSWEPMLRKREHSMHPWKGSIDGVAGAGWIITYPQGSIAMQVLQRLAIQGNSMTLLVWEGPAAATDLSASLFDRFHIPEAWVSATPPETDIYRGLGPKGLHFPFPGSLDIHVEIPTFGQQQAILVNLLYTPPSPQKSTEKTSWQLPSGARALPLEDDFNGRKIRYRIPLDKDSGMGAPFGIARIGGPSFSAIDPLWLALPSSCANGKALQPPAWHLQVSHLANLQVLSTPLQSKIFDAQSKAYVSDFQALPAGLAWPFFVAGNFELRQTRGLNWFLRLDSKAALEENAVSELVRMSKVLQTWLPSPIGAWTVASYPWIGDHVLPGLILLDEKRDWFQQPVDAIFEALPRRVALARLLCQQRFGVLQHGDGSASLFLEASLAEYLSWRLLAAAGNQADADTLLAWWKKTEDQAGPLLQPLSMLPIEDLYGPRRLLSFGPLVWRAIEQHCGRQAFDQFLTQRLQKPGWWSTKELESALEEANPDLPWEDFLLQHVYGRILPADTETTF